MKKQDILPSILSWLPFGLFLIVLSYYGVSHYLIDHDNYWESRSFSVQSKREIASYKDKLEFDAFRQYFNTNSFNKFLNFKMTLDFWSSYSNSKEKNIIREALQSSFFETFEPTNPKSISLSTSKLELLESSINKFVNTLAEKKISNGEFQVNLNFTPNFEQNLNYNKELSTNQLVNIEKKDLAQTLSSKEEQQIEKVLTTPIPSLSQRYQYSGGTITIFIKANDLNKNLYNGYIRFRRYFRANDLSSTDLNIETKNFNLTYFQLEKASSKYSNFLTVDLYKNFNTSTQIPQKNHLDIHFGKLLSSKIEQKDLPNSITTGDFYINGTFPIKGVKSEVKVKLDKLTYSFQKNSFTDDSKLMVTLRTDKQGPHDLEKFMIKKIIKENLAEKIVKHLELENFHQSFNTTGEKE
ncbi:hypothetical protein [Halobacteriovorax sp. HLS]|uniref:hypothetical protein n=1 Tax=Halobacteriovorax sp. HLS TaxID=2234000 RepID=UPI000FDBB702|nr:hypothetical protein [Halobacteriovorax sp. HLS]